MPSSSLPSHTFRIEDESTLAGDARTLRRWVVMMLALLPGACASTETDVGALKPAGCEDLATQRIGVQGLVVTSAQRIPASAGAPAYPAHCAVTGQLDARQGLDGKPYAIGFELRLPLDGYVQRLFFQGGGGTDGVTNPAYGDLINTTQTNALSLGYAVVSTDGGHAGGAADVSFGLDPQARIDYGYNAVGRSTEAAKAIVRAFYGRAPRRSYFVGCSNGGRQALVAASRFPQEFDGIIAIDPGFNLPKAALAQAWDTQLLFRAGAPGQLPRDAFPPATLSSVAAGILARCDGLDGLADGMVNDDQQCQLAFDLERDAPTCSGASATGCLSAAQKAALQAVFDGVHDSSGASLYSSWPWDPGLAGAGWRFWKLDAGFAPLPFNTIIGASALGYIFTTPPDQPELSDGGVAYQLGFDFDADAPKIFASDAAFTQSAMEFMTPPTPARLTSFGAQGSKLLVVHGSADPVFSVADTVAWYGSLLAGDQHAAEYARLFLVPGMNHCTGGPATDRFDSLSALDGWIDSGDAPESIIAGVDPANPDVAAQGWPTTRTRPVCAYPKHAQLLPGATDSESASSFSCQ